MLLGLAGRRFFDARAGLVAAALLAVYPPAIFFDGLIQKSSLDLLLMTTLLALMGRWNARAGLAPLMFETSFQAKFLIPMAVTLTFGLLFATGLTLVLVPAINLIFFDIEHAVSRLFTRRHAAPLPSRSQPASAEVTP